MKTIENTGVASVKYLFISLLIGRFTIKKSRTDRDFFTFYYTNSATNLSK